MRRISATESVTLDGVMQAPAGLGPEEDDGFSHGGWALPYSDEELYSIMGEGLGGPGAMLFGRRTWQHLGAFWPSQPDTNQYAKILNASPKYVVSRTLTKPGAWANSIVLDGVGAVTALRATEGPDLTVLGSAELLGALLRAGLVDELTVLVHPVVLGSGRMLFPSGAAPSDLRLTRCRSTSAGVIIATYEPVSRKD
jgi:dihydrofolate reductase